MAGLESKEVIKLVRCRVSEAIRDINSFLVKGEITVFAFDADFGRVMFTNKRIILSDTYGGSNGRVNYTSLPYSKASSFSVEKGEDENMPVGLSFCFPEIGIVKFEIAPSADDLNLSRMISCLVLE